MYDTIPSLSVPTDDSKCNIAHVQSYACCFLLTFILFAYQVVDLLCTVTKEKFDRNVLGLEWVNDFRSESRDS